MIDGSIRPVCAAASLSSAGSGKGVVVMLLVGVIDGVSDLMLDGVIDGASDRTKDGELVKDEDGPKVSSFELSLNGVGTGVPRTLGAELVCKVGEELGATVIVGNALGALLK